MTNLLLVDFENVHRLDTSGLDSSYHVVVFVGARQKAPGTGSAPTARAHRPLITFQSIQGVGKNALDFHIAFYLGRVFESAKETRCYVLSHDKGFDPLLRHLNSSGLLCRRIDSLQELPASESACPRCGGLTLIEHNDGLWCSICAVFVVDPDPRHTAHIKGRPSGADLFSQRHSLTPDLCVLP